MGFAGTYAGGTNAFAVDTAEAIREHGYLIVTLGLGSVPRSVMTAIATAIIVLGNGASAWIAIASRKGGV